MITMSDFTSTIRTLVRRYAFDFSAVAKELNIQIESGLYHDQVSGPLSAEQCREIFSNDYLNTVTATPKTGVGRATIDSDDRLRRQMHAVETVADAVQFEEALSKASMEKREAIFKRVLAHLGPMPDDVKLPGIGSDVSEALEGFEARREMSRLKAEAALKERQEKDLLG